MKVLTGAMLKEYISKLRHEVDQKKEAAHEAGERLKRAERLLNALEDSRTTDAASIGFDVGCTMSGRDYASNLRLQDGGD